ncbi:S66 family peptidase [Actinokineospora iranica]|uniref:Muramoyltetrapeptide carboxypeptidase LdcA (Peptidoglycan recycling) n=1 Tax=Actinokineospora iranica TaxID=1271860 RepID=A0A1G6RWE2_9PSEU|nr:S66 peptidase family protein [Actinokineospora iranica]SDD08909.1 Muramoyltetrapeptide carboxypeptidase LdcA (peptidoglycan recycling) [Actinokineospora iranica]
MRHPTKPRPGDRVAVLSPSAGLPGLFPLPFDLGLLRLREDFGLVPVEYPTTRRMGSTPEDRAVDIHAAFADPEIAAVISSIGGDDQIRVLPHLDAALLRANPKPFFGYSDNTAFLAYLWAAGVIGFHGGAVMTQFGRPGALHPVTAAALRAALFTTGPYDLPEVTASGDIDRPWDDPATFDSEPPLRPCSGWRWHNADQVVEGRSWGGNVEVLSWLLMADRAIRPVEDYAGSVLLLETSEEMPTATEVYRVLRSMGERGLLRQFPAALVGRPKTWYFSKRTTPAEAAAYRDDQRAAVLRAFAEYSPAATLVFDVDFGHTDPQVVLPYGAPILVDGPGRRVTVTY